jgi:hypothetical protein
VTAGPWRLLILDAAPDDPVWLIATVSASSDVRAAIMEVGGRRYADWPQVTEWVRAQVGQRVQLTPASAMVWRIAGEAGSGTEGDES